MRSCPENVGRQPPSAVPAQARGLPHFLTNGARCAPHRCTATGGGATFLTALDSKKLKPENRKPYQNRVKPVKVYMSLIMASYSPLSFW
jgi:hypothetical protein